MSEERIQGTFIRLVKCPICNKQFIPAPQHCYKVQKRGTSSASKYVCSWSCLQAARKSKKWR